jgi:hypothetical protein
MTMRGWQEFREAGLLWWVNRSLHLFGWAIVVEEGANGAITGAYPTRVWFRGFGKDREELGFQQLTRHLSETVPELLSEVTPRQDSPDEPGVEV